MEPRGEGRDVHPPYQNGLNLGGTRSAPSGGRTHTWRILSPLPLPLGYRGERESESLLGE